MKKAAAKKATTEPAAPLRWREVPLDGLPDTDDGWTYADAETSLKLQASLRRHGQMGAAPVIATVDGALRVLDGRRLIAAMRALGWQTGTVCDLGEVSAEDAAIAAVSAELRFETDYARLSQAVHRMHVAGVTLDRIASAGPWSAERVGHLDTLATFDWSQFAEVDDGQSTMDWDAEEVAAAPVTPEPVTGLPVPGPAPAPPQAPEAVPPAVAPAPAPPEAQAAAASPAKVKAKKPAPPPGPSLFDDMDEGA